MTFIIFLSHNFQRNLTKINNEIPFTGFSIPGELNKRPFHFRKIRALFAPKNIKNQFR